MGKSDRSMVQSVEGARDTIRSAPTWEAVIHLSLLLALFLGMAIAFSGRAFNVDEGVYIRCARHILIDPLHPYDYQVKADAIVHAFPAMPHPPLINYLIALTMVLVNGVSETLIHTSFSVFLVLAIVSMYFLVQRFGGNPLLTCAVLFSTPAMLVACHDATTDFPMLSLWLASVATYVYGLDRGSKPLLFLAALFIGLATVTKYPALSLYPLLLFYSLINRRPLARSILFLLMSLAPFALWCVQNLVFYGKIHLISIPAQITPDIPGTSDFSLSSLTSNAISSPIFLGATTVFPVFLLWVLLKYRGNRIAYPFLLAASAIIAVTYHRVEGYTIFFQKIALVFFLSSGLLVIYHVISRSVATVLSSRPILKPGPRNADIAFLAVWFLGVLLYNILVCPFSAARYLLPAIPPLVLLLGTDLEALSLSKGSRLRITLSNIVAWSTLALGLAVASADYQFAGTQRDFARSVKERYAESTKVWFNGYWGFRYYMEQEGHEFLAPAHDLPSSGDIFITPLFTFHNAITNELNDRLELLQEVSYSSSMPLRILNHAAKAGFYSNGYGFLPYYLAAADPVEKYQIFRAK